MLEIIHENGKLTIKPESVSSFDLMNLSTNDEGKVFYLLLHILGNARNNLETLKFKTLEQAHQCIQSIVQSKEESQENRLMQYRRI